MPYQMPQMTPQQMETLQRSGMGMMGMGAPAFADQNGQQPTAMQPWWQQRPTRQSASQSANSPDVANPAAKPPPSLVDMMLSVGRMTRPQYDKAIRGPGAYGIAPQTAAQLGPWAFLGSLGMPGGPR